MRGPRLTFGQRVSAAFAAMVVLTATVGLLAVSAQMRVAEIQERVTDDHVATVFAAQRVHEEVETKISSGLAFLLTGDERYLDEIQDGRDELARLLDELAARVDDPTSATLVEDMRASEANHQAGLEQLFSVREAGDISALVAQYQAELRPLRASLRGDVDAFIEHEQALLEQAQAQSSATTDRARSTTIALTVLALLVAVLLATWLGRWLRRAIGSAIAEVESSSAELQTAANQQASSTQEQTSSMNEIATTINELLSTSRQIAEAAQRVARTATDASSAGEAGRRTIDDALDAIEAIRAQMDTIVQHMLELGERSQRIGGVLDIVAELSEQTNILAINASIEAAGAGETGTRFGVVADEIRKLADRVGQSTQEVRGLIDSVRNSVNSAVMATEAGSKSVDDGARHVDRVVGAFTEIEQTMQTTSEVSREIELSTKQQSSAVEQVNVAITDVAQAARETDASAAQTLQTSRQLTAMARELQGLVAARASD